MKSNIVQSINKLKQSYDLFEDFQRQHPFTKGAAIAKHYNTKILWIYKDFVSNPSFNDKVREGVIKEWNSDIFIIDAINNKIGLLAPEKRELIETIIDALLNGEEINIIN